MISNICDLLRSKLYQCGFEYGFFLNGRKYKPNFSNGFDKEYDELLKTIYLVQNPAITAREKIGTCIDSVVLMKTELDNISIPCKIWLLHSKTNNSMHTILTFSAEDKIVYLELTPQSSKPWYGKEIVYDTESDLIRDYVNRGYEIFDVTKDVMIGSPPSFLLLRLQ